jgi:L-lactate dehydrogenase complex protein LldE
VTTARLFVPCYVDQLYPRVAIATLQLLERLGVQVEVPRKQTCCGQPMANTGCNDEAAPLAEKFLRDFGGAEYVVAPSGSCVSMVRNHYGQFLAGRPGFEELRSRTFELCEFLVDVLHVEKLPGRFPRTVGLHRSCHGLRELRLGSGSERSVPPFDKVKGLLASIDEIKLVEPSRTDECCGFGGTFAVTEQAVSGLMGRDRIADHEKAGAEIIAGFDMSCLMHLDGLIQRNKRPIRTMHVAEIFAEAAA